MLYRRGGIILFKTIIKKFKEWYRRRFYNVAIDYSNGTDYTAETRYSIDKQGNIKIQSVNLIAPRSTCEKCGAPGELYAHHLKRISPDTLFKHYASNEVKILCRSCHLDAHRIGKNKYDKDITRALYLISARQNGKTATFTDFLQTRFIQITNPRVWHLARYAKKNRTRKKNISRLKKIRRRIYE